MSEEFYKKLKQNVDKSVEEDAKLLKTLEKR